MNILIGFLAILGAIFLLLILVFLFCALTVGKDDMYDE